MRGYKIFDSDWTCRGFQYAVGETATVEGDPVMCKSGLHFCERALDCLRYYSLMSSNKYAEVIAEGVTVTEGDKSTTNKLTVVRELSYEEFMSLCTGTISSRTKPCRIDTPYVRGVREGCVRDYYRNGNIRRESHYVNDVRHGITSLWHANGVKWLEAIFDNGVRRSMRKVTPT